MSRWRLVGDVGGSNARFARASRGTITERRNYAVRDYPSFYDALRQYLTETGGVADCDSVAVCAAGPVDGGAVKLTNASWTIDEREIGQMLGGLPSQLVNDLQAAAVGLPHLPAKDLTRLGPDRAEGPRRTMLALNVGTGFGAAMAVPVRDSWISHGCEPGHMALGGISTDELSVVESFPTVEDLLSGRGVKALYARLAARRGLTITTPLCGSEIFASAGSDPVAGETVQYFSRLLGRVAGDLALATGSWGGVFLCGSVVQGWEPVADAAEFRACFEAKGAMTERMHAVYSGVIEMDDISLFGLTHLEIAA